MGERKVLNKYFPPDFDPAKLPRGRRGDADGQMKVRMMLPMSIRCGTCGTYMYKGTKFNSRKEDVVGEDYLGIMIFRFYFRCNNCAAEITMKTDPQNSDYAMEHGATRNYEPWRDKDQQTADAVRQREEEEAGNAMKALENRTLDSKREMDIMTALDELKSLSSRHAAVDTEAALAALKHSAAEDEIELEAADEAAVRAMLQQRAVTVKRIDERAAAARPAAAAAAMPGLVATAAAGAKPPLAGAPAGGKPGGFGVKPRPLAVMVTAKRKPEAEAAAANGSAGADAKRQAVDANGAGSNSGATNGVPADSNGGGEGGGLAGLMGAYGSGSSDSDS